MPRIARFKINNAIYHIFNRGNQRQEVFLDDEDFQTFLSIAAYYKLKYGFKNYHFILIPNHFHFLWGIENAEIMPKAMKEISLAYTKAHHRKYDTVGYLWQGRYKSMIVDKERYLDRLGGYIERNALRSGLVKNPGQWKWSSYRFYAYGKSLKILVNKMGSTLFS
jgi:putative transposase